MKLIHGDSLDKLKLMDTDSVDSLVTDPPAGISFVGKDWDSQFEFKNQMLAIFKECIRVMKPGAHGLVWALPRTSHHTAIALETAGFEVRDVISHLFGSGFPKSHDVSKAIDKMLGAEREVIGNNPNHRLLVETTTMVGEPHSGDGSLTAPKTPDAIKWQGWGSALKPSSEHWILVRRPLAKGLTIAQNVLLHGTGGLNIDASRVRTLRCEKTLDKLSASSVKPSRGPDVVGNLKNSVIKNATDSSGEDGLITRLNLSTKQDMSDSNIGMIQKESIATSLSTDTCGEKKSSQDMLSTTKMKLNQITESTILNSCEDPTTSECTQGNQTNIQRWEQAQNIQRDGKQITPNIKLSTLKENESGEQLGRWPSNLILSHSDGCVEACEPGCPVAELDAQSIAGGMHSAGSKRENKRDLDSDKKGIFPANGKGGHRLGDSGGASRFFQTFAYFAKASKRERNEGLPELAKPLMGEFKDNPGSTTPKSSPVPRQNHHPTVKNIKLMSYLIKLITPPNGIVLDCFMGSGSTGVAAIKNGFDFVGIERELEYFAIAHARIKHEELKNGN
jgi:DNA modification methylase